MSASETEPNWLNDEQQGIWRTYLLATNLFAQRLNDDLKEDGLDLAEYEVLVALSETKNRSLRMSELADKVHQSRSRLTHTVSRMERDGLIVRGDSPIDRRGVVARLTEPGYKKLVKAAPHHVTAVRTYLVDVIDPDDFRALGRAMTNVLNAVKHRSGEG